MSFLLDTHVLLWWLAGEEIEASSAERILNVQARVLVSAASVWEIAIKRNLGKIRFAGSVGDAVRREGFDLLVISDLHAEDAGALPLHHRDPFDRMIIAQAKRENLVVLTRDPVFAAYEVSLLHC